MGQSGEKRKEPMLQNAMNVSNHVHNQFKKHKPFGGFQEKGFHTGQNNKSRGDSTPEVRMPKPLYDRNGKERIYNCRKCQKNHP